MSKKNIYIYEWNGWDGYLFPTAFENAVRIKARFKEPTENIISPLEKPGYFLFHINLTFSDAYFLDKQGLIDALLRRGILPLNAFAGDISKVAVQNNCIALGINSTKALIKGDASELLIVKPSLNYGGIVEQKLAAKHRQMLGLQYKFYRGWDYKITERSNIPITIWESPDYSVEKFITNSKGKFYRVYKVMNSLILSKVFDRSMLKKMQTGISRKNYYYQGENITTKIGYHHQIIDYVKRLSTAMGVDLAAIDIVMDDKNQPYIIDVNTTPWWGEPGHSGMLIFLKNGIYKLHLADR